MNVFSSDDMEEILHIYDGLNFMKEYYEGIQKIYPDCYMEETKKINNLINKINPIIQKYFQIM